jgi:NAD(P)-dependent dehydrogenase (short-subunit alcohol dehydrogenase family)
MVINNNLFTLTGKVALITGGGQHIGEVFCNHLAAYGAKSVIIDINSDKAEQLAHELSTLGYEAIAITADVTRPLEIEGALQKIINHWGRLDIAFNNVGICYGNAAEEFSLDDWNHILNVNLTATFCCCQQEAKIMKQHGYGKIINTASVAGVMIPHPQKITAYNTAKGAVIHLSRSLAAEWAQYGIRVNSLSPGVVMTSALNTISMQDWIKTWNEQIPLGRLAHLEDLAGAAVFLASSASDYMTGQNMIIDGGHVLW